MAIACVDRQAVPPRRHVAQRHFLLEAAYQAAVACLYLAHHAPALDGQDRIVPLPLLGSDERYALHYDDVTPPPSPPFTHRLGGQASVHSCK